MSANGWYVYGVVDGGRTVDPDGGVGLVHSGPVAAIVTRVELAEFDDLDERLNDPAWLEEKARHHETVVSRASREGPVVPLRFGAIYRRREDVEKLLTERRDEFVADLERVRGRVELGVKGYVARGALEELLARQRTTTPAASPGRAYLERRQVQQDIAAEAKAMVAEAARRTHTRLLERSVAGAVSRPHSRELSGRTEDMFLNAAYLVPAGDDSLRGEIAALQLAYAPLSVSFEVTGPWPPYSFVGGEERR